MTQGVLTVLEGTYPRHGGGGAESQVLTLTTRLQKSGVPVSVVVPRVADGPQATRDEVAGVPVVRIAYPRVKLVGGAVMLCRLATHLWRRRRDYEVIHAHIAHNMAAVACVVGRALGKRVYVKITGMREMRGGILDPQPGFSSRLRRRAVQRATAVQATSTRIAQLLRDCGFTAAQVAVLPNGVDTQRFVPLQRDPAARTRHFGDARRVGVFVGRLAPEKGQELLIEAWSRAFPGRTDCRLLLVGDGPTRGTLEALASQRGIAGAVVFAGHSDDVAPWLALADFALLTSLAEGLSNALLEAMASGLPVIGSRVSGTEDFVLDGQTGELFEPGDLDGLVRALQRIDARDDAALARMGAAARAKILAEASLEAVTARLLALYGVVPIEAAPPERSVPCVE